MPASLPISPRLRALLWGAYAGLVAFLILAVFVAQFGVDVPYWDEWVELAYYARQRAGALTWYDVWAQHNEHRIPISRLIWIALYDLVGEWNVVTQMACSAAAMGLSVATLGYALARLGVAPLAIVTLAVLLTSPLQWENILWGYQIQCFTLVFGMALAIGAIALDEALRPRTIALAVLGCVIATFSFASGLGVWAAVAALLALRVALRADAWRAPAARRAIIQRLVVFALAAIAAAAAFFYGFIVPHNPYGAPNAIAFAASVARFLAYPLLDGPTPLHLALAATLWGAVALAIAGDVRDRHLAGARDRLVFRAGVVLALLASAAIIGYGRGGAVYVPSRYATIFLLNVVVWLPALADLSWRAGAWPRRRTIAARGALAALAAALLVVHGNRYLHGLGIMRDQRDNRLVAREAAAFFLRDHSPNLPFAGFAIFPAHVQQQGDLGRPELVAVLPPEMRPELSAPPAATFGNAWAPGCGYEAVAGTKPAYSWGTWCPNGPGATGRIAVGPIAIEQPLLRVPIAGQIGAAGASLIIQDIADPRRRVSYAGAPPGDAWTNWDADVEALIGRQVVLIGIDDVRQPPGWLAFGRPRPMSRALSWFDRLLGQAGLALRIVVLSSLGVVLVLAQRRRVADEIDAPAPPRPRRTKITAS